MLSLEKPKENPKGNPAQKSSEKRKMTSFHDRIPKKPKMSPRPDKHCDLCEKHGGAPKTHNTSECKKYRPDGTPKKQVVRPDKKHDHKK